MGKNRFYGLSLKEIDALSKEEKIAWAYAFVTGMDTDDAEKEIEGENLDEVREYVQRRLYDKKVAVESFIKLLNSIEK